MTPDHNPYGDIPEFFAAQCEEHGLPLNTVVEDTAGFVAAILANPDETFRVRMRRYMDRRVDGYNYLLCYLRTLGGLSGDDAGRVANEVFLGVCEAGITLTYRDIKK